VCSLGETSDSGLGAIRRVERDGGLSTAAHTAQGLATRSASCELQSALDSTIRMRYAYTPRQRHPDRHSSPHAAPTPHGNFWRLGASATRVPVLWGFLCNGTAHAVYNSNGYRCRLAGWLRHARIAIPHRDVEGRTPCDAACVVGGSHGHRPASSGKAKWSSFFVFVSTKAVGKHEHDSVYARTTNSEENELLDEIRDA